MKVTFDIDCTPAEARAFFGLPDLTAVHDVYLDKMKAMMSDGLGPADFERMTRTWMPGMADGFEQWRQMFFNAAAGLKPPV